jgi:YVTN family beta-propeller protein
MYAGSALIGVIAAAVAIPVFAFAQGGSGSGITVEGNAVAEIDPGSDQVVGQVPNVGARPGPIAYGSRSLWVANLDDQTVARVDPASSTVVRSVPVRSTPTGLATTPGAVWVVGANAGNPSVTVRRLDSQFDTVDERTTIGNVVPGGPGYVATRGSDVWVAPSAGLVSRLEPATAKVAQQIDPNAGPAAIALGDDATWIADSYASTVVRIDPTGVLTPIGVGNGPRAIAVGESGVWVANTLADTVTRIDPATRAATTTISVGKAPTGIAVGAGAVWVANSGDGTVTRYDSVKKTTRTIPVGGSPQAVAVAEGRVWVTVDERSIGAAPAAGGTARLGAQDDVDFMDPALAFAPMSWGLLYATCAELVNYPDKAAPEGSQLKAEVAEALPRRSADGRTYTFTIRKGFRFSPPSNEPVTAETFRYTIERTLAPVMRSAADSYMHDIVGADDYMAGKAAHISGITARGNRLSIRLRAPAPDIVARLALPFFCAVPVGTPLDPKGVRTIPMAGPYYLKSYVPGQGVVLIRNPNYRGGRPHRLDRVVLTVGVAGQTVDRQVEAGRLDMALQGVANPDQARLAARYGPGSPAAKAARRQYFENPSMGLDFITFNTHRPLVRDARLRRAVNYAIDRTTLARIGNPLMSGLETPTDQYLPPGMPGFKDARVYPFTPNIAAARRLAGNTRRTAVLYACNKPPCDQLAQVLKTNLAAIGIDVQVKTFSTGAIFGRLGRAGEPYDLAFSGGWVADYADPADMLNHVIGSGAGVFPPFDDPTYQREVGQAAKLSGPRRFLTYGTLDARVARDEAPIAAFGNSVSRDFFSARMGCQVFQPVYGMDLAALCTRR